MKIKRLTIKNVTSYKEETTFEFDDRFNILIGPNGGGKSNLQKILAVVLNSYFIYQYDFKQDDKESKIEIVDLWSRKVLEKNLDHFSGDAGDQIISIELRPEPSDVKNIQLIGQNLDKFNQQRSFWETSENTYPPFDHIDLIRASDSFTYKIVNLVLQEPEVGTPAWAFKEYLRSFFIYMRLSNKIPEISLSSPFFIFFSQRTFNRNLTIQTNQIAEQQYFANYRNVSRAAMGETTDLFQFGTQHFFRIYWRAITKAGSRRDVTTQDLIKEDPEVQLLDKYLIKLGYEWGFATDEESVTFAFYLQKDGQPILAEKFSSGEKEIVHFLLAMFALNVKDGLILIDEPELHLHPRWQRIFLSLFKDIAVERNNQFIVATHSPVFVTPETINDITRVYRTPNGSQKVALKDIKLPDKRNLVRMINSQNNERLFFADKVVLVEGITDRLVISSLIDGAAERFSNNQAIEVIEVGGKHNFSQYRSLLATLETPSFVVADQDYLSDFGSQEVRKVFVQDKMKSGKALLDKKSKDGASLLKILEGAVAQADLKELKTFLDYLKGRHKRIKDSLTKVESELLQHELESFKKQQIWVLAQGEIERYLPDGVSSLDDIIVMLANRDWIIDVKDEIRRLELINLACSILAIPKEQSAKLREEVIARKKGIFPPLLSNPEDAAGAEEIDVGL